jgi:hypothetical protein
MHDIGRSQARADAVPVSAMCSVFSAFASTGFITGRIAYLACVTEESLSRKAYIDNTTLSISVPHIMDIQFLLPEPEPDSIAAKVILSIGQGTLAT